MPEDVSRRARETSIEGKKAQRLYAGEATTDRGVTNTLFPVRGLNPRGGKRMAGP